MSTPTRAAIAESQRILQAVSELPRLTPMEASRVHISPIAVGDPISGSWRYHTSRPHLDRCSFDAIRVSSPAEAQPARQSRNCHKAILSSLSRPRASPGSA